MVECFTFPRQPWNIVGFWPLSPWNCLFWIQGVRASAALLLTYLLWTIPVSASECSINCGIYIFLLCSCTCLTLCVFDRHESFQVFIWLQVFCLKSDKIPTLINKILLFSCWLFIRFSDNFCWGGSHVCFDVSCPAVVHLCACFSGCSIHWHSVSFRTISTAVVKGSSLSRPTSSCSSVSFVNVPAQTLTLQDDTRPWTSSDSLLSSLWTKV